MENSNMVEEAVEVKRCASEIIDVLVKHFPDRPDLGLTTLVFMLVRISSTLGVDAKSVSTAVDSALEAQALMEAEVPNQYVN